jgi:hypothetical protein
VKYLYETHRINVVFGSWRVTISPKDDGALPVGSPITVPRSLS